MDVVNGGNGGRGGVRGGDGCGGGDSAITVGPSTSTPQETELLEYHKVELALTLNSVKGSRFYIFSIHISSY